MGPQRPLHVVADPGRPAGQLLAPAGPDLAVQYIDARDLAAWILDGAESTRTGTYNATSPPGTRTLGEVLDAAAVASGRSPEVVWADEDFLLDQGVEPWSELPLWVPSKGDFAGFTSYDTSAAEREGLTLRPTAETVADTLEWALEVGEAVAVPSTVGLDSDREQDIIATWRATRR